LYAGPLATWPLFRPVTEAQKLACPVLVQLGERDITVPSRAIEKLARRAPRAVLKRYDVNHFQAFYGSNRASFAADQVAWLKDTVLAG